ncbi:MvaI/BcnI family restriction endonuclease [Pseudoalteromonas sp. B137]
MWFGKLGQICVPSDQIAIIIKDDAAYLINLSRASISKTIQSEDSLIGGFLNELCKKEFSIAEELLNKLKELAKKPMPALRSGSTGVGFTLETMLGIEANSSKEPDYKGIEIKSGRGGKNRTTLFAQVPDWSISPCKKSAEILNKYGYEREDDFKLYCTLSTQKNNS